MSKKFTVTVKTVSVLTITLQIGFLVSVGFAKVTPLSPTLFGVSINDLLAQVKQLGHGLEILNENLSILVYADDVVVLGTTEVELLRNA